MEFCQLITFRLIVVVMEKLTWPQPSLVDPSMHLALLLLQAVDVRPQIRHLRLQCIHLVMVGPQRSIEGLREQIRRILLLHRISAATTEPIRHRCTASTRTPRSTRTHRRTGISAAHALRAHHLRRLTLTRIHAAGLLYERITQLRCLVAVSAVEGPGVAVKRLRAAVLVVDVGAGVVVGGGVSLTIVTGVVVVDVGLRIAARSAEALEEHAEARRRRRGGRRAEGVRWVVNGFAGAEEEVSARALGSK